MRSFSPPASPKASNVLNLQWSCRVEEKGQPRTRHNQDIKRAFGKRQMAWTGQCAGGVYRDSQQKCWNSDNWIGNKFIIFFLHFTAIQEDARCVGRCGHFCQVESLLAKGPSHSSLSSEMASLKSHLAGKYKVPKSPITHINSTGITCLFIEWFEISP